MTIETDYRAVLLAHAPLVAIVSTDVSLGAAPTGVSPPYVVFSSAHDPELLLDGSVAIDRVTLETQCWAKTSAVASDIAAAVEAAIAAQDPRSFWVLSRGSGYDQATDLHGELLTVESII